MFENVMSAFVIVQMCNGLFPAASSPFVIAFEDLLKGEFAKFMELSGKIGGDIQTQVGLFIFFFGGGGVDAVLTVFQLNSITGAN